MFAAVWSCFHQSLLAEQKPLMCSWACTVISSVVALGGAAARFLLVSCPHPFSTSASSGPCTFLVWLPWPGLCLGTFFLILPLPTFLKVKSDDLAPLLTGLGNLLSEAEGRKPGQMQGEAAGGPGEQYMTSEWENKVKSGPRS